MVARGTVLRCTFLIDERTDPVAEHCNLYDRATYYDVIFNRDVTREVQFVKDAYARYAAKSIGPVLDMACGPGYHAKGFARQGHKSYGLDLRAEMLKFADDGAKKEKLNVHWIEADMRKFHLPEKVDATFCMFDGLDCLLSNDDLIAHFSAVANNLTPNGIYIVDLSHPKEVSFSHYKKFHYSGERDGAKVDIYWATNNPQYDLATGIAHVALEMHVDDNGKKIVVKDEADERLLFPQEISLLAESSGKLKVVGWYGDFDINQPLDHSEASQRMIAVLQRVG
jgi:SAM-dependent methyltransferase